MLSTMSATLDRYLNKRFEVVADDEELRNSLYGCIVGFGILAFIEEPIKDKPRFARWLLSCLGFRI